MAATLSSVACRPSTSGSVARPSQARVSLVAAPVRAAPLRASVAVAATAESVGADKWNKTYYPTGADTAAVDKEWFVIDAEGQTLGRLACLAANIIRGKDQPTYTPSQDMGNFVIVINADKVVVSGRKFDDKLYRRHSTGRPGTMKTETFKELQARLPERIIETAIKGMLPKGRLGNRLFHHMKVYRGASHPHEPQAPVDVTHKINQKFTK